jgi:hypothetical protein
MRRELPSLAALMLLAAGSAHAQAPTVTQVFNDVCGPVLLDDPPDMEVATEGARRLGFAVEYREPTYGVQELDGTGHGAEFKLDVTHLGGSCMYVLPNGASRVSAEQEVDRRFSEWKRRSTTSGYVWNSEEDAFFAGEATVLTRADGRIVVALESWW